MITRFLGIFVLAALLGGCAGGVGPSLEGNESAIQTGLSYTDTDMDFHPEPEGASPGSGDKVLPKLNGNFTLPAITDTLSHQWKRTVELMPAAHTSCLPDELRAIVVKAGKYFKSHVIITSAHRTIRHNRRVGGARGSYHLHCQAVDMRVPGVSKSRLARFIRSLPERGGLGTYCGKGIVHVDVGPRREWHYGCRKNRLLARKNRKQAPKDGKNRIVRESRLNPANRLKLLGIKSSL